MYFRGKPTYAETFANPPAGAPGVLIITPNTGLRSPDEPIGLDVLRAFAAVEVHEKNASYRKPLENDARRIAGLISPECEVVLLGSIATGKYIEVLADAFGTSLRFPVEFVGRGDMSRGGLLLRCVDTRAELEYIEVSGARCRGPRPPKLPKC